MTPPAGNATMLFSRFDAREGGPESRWRAVLVALPRDAGPPIAFRDSMLQHLRIVLVDRHRAPELAASNPVVGPVVGEVPRLMLPAGAPPGTAPPALRHSRRVRGEILCDESGRFYEKIGSRVRPVHQLAAGPGGEILDVAPSTPMERQQPIDVPGERQRVRRRTGPPDLDLPADQDHDDRTPAVTHRTLALASGHRRVVRFGAHKEMLAPQLRHPERLRDAHRLPCRLHVYESLRAQRLESLAAAVFGDQPTHPLCALTPEAAAALDATALAVRHVPPQRERREAGLVFRGERVFWLEVTDDPTSTFAPAPDAPQGTAAGASPALAAARPANGMPVVRKTTIPDHFLGPWEFKVGRDEAVYEMNEQAARGWLRSWVARWLERSMKADSFRKWHVLLAGKGLDEQLWGVRPPRGGLTHPTVRDWARATLDAAGYDAGPMLSEWEIYWRRKGL